MYYIDYCIHYRYSSVIPPTGVYTSLGNKITMNSSLNDSVFNCLLQYDTFGTSNILWIRYFTVMFVYFNTNHARIHGGRTFFGRFVFIKRYCDCKYDTKRISHYVCSWFYSIITLICISTFRHINF